jgi:hypothetical protein
LDEHIYDTVASTGKKAQQKSANGLGLVEHSDEVGASPNASLLRSFPVEQGADEVLSRPTTAMSMKRRTIVQYHYTGWGDYRCAVKN